MRSKAHFKSHPLHSILIVFPVAFFNGAFLFDLLFLFTRNYTFWQTGFHLTIAGITGALLAAIPGIIDYFFTVPPQSSGKKRASRHALLNLINILLFSFSLYYRQKPTASAIVVSVVEGIGIIILAIAGWLGGTLVHRNQIGIDHRYANAGKWKETHLETEKIPVVVASIDELKVNALKLLHVAGKRIVLGRTENGYVAFDDRCTHRGGSLADGVLICGIVHCPWHGSHFDVHSGTVKAGPAETRISTYKIEEREGKVLLYL